MYGAQITPAGIATLGQAITAPKPDQSLGVPDEMKYLMGNLDSLAKSVEELRVRLSGVLRPSEPANPGQVAVAAPTTSPLARAIADARYMVMNIGDAVSDIHRRLDA